MSADTPSPEGTRPSEKIPRDAEDRDVRPDNADLSGRSVGDYRLLRRLGSGGMADVYLAEQNSLKRQVAFKVLRADLAKDETYVRRFLHEAQAAASLVHANIVQIYEVGEIDGVHFIAQEYVQGRNLREYLDRNGPPDVRFAVLIMRQVAAALYRAAQANIVHRDIKPENVMIARTGEVKVADFGLARVFRDGEKVSLTQAGVTMGTPLYMSPEQAEGKPLDHRSDLYSLGVTCYHMLAGQPPFRGETALSIAVQHVKTQPEPLEEIRPDLPEGLCRIVHRLLEKDPAQRYDTARELMRDLRMLAIEGLDEEAEDDELWNALGVELAGPIEAARHLDAVMKTTAMELNLPSRRGWWLAAALLGAVLLGGAISLRARERPLLEETNAVASQKNAQAQFIYAGLMSQRDWFNSQRYWESVVNFEPREEVYARMAKMQLGLIYLYQPRRLKDNDDEKALRIFNEFAKLSEVDRDFRLFGIAGQCVIASLQNQHPKAANQFRDQILPLLGKVQLDPQMSKALLAAVQKSFQATRATSPDRKIEAWLNEYLRNENGDSKASDPES